MSATLRPAKIVSAVFAVIVTLTSVRATAARESSRPPHLQAAMDLLAAIEPSDTNYQHHNGVVHFPGDGPGRAECRTDCSGFVDAVLKRAYGLSSVQLSDWLDAKRPLAKHYHAAIAAEHGFQRIPVISDARPGDILAVTYPAGAKENNTGHVMIVASQPKQRTPSVPVVGDTLQWEVPVIDESETGHGKTDTRHRPDKTSADGLGRGILRIYTNHEGRIAGYAWSVLQVSKFQSQSAHNMVIGRIEPDFIRSIKMGGQ
jgi:hypothetical protein